MVLFFYFPLSVNLLLGHEAKSLQVSPTGTSRQLFMTHVHWKLLSCFITPLLSPHQPSLAILLWLIQNRWTSFHPPILREPRGKSQRRVRTWKKKNKSKKPKRSCSRRHFQIFVIYQLWQHCAACCQGWKLHHTGLVDLHPTKSTSFYNQWTPHNLLVSKSI